MATATGTVTIDESPAAAPRVSGSRPLRAVLASPVLAEAKLLAGKRGLDRPVERLNVMEVPDIQQWVKPRELLLTTAYPVRDNPERLPQLIRDLDTAGLSGMAIKLGRYLDELPSEALEVADHCGFPVISLPEQLGFDEIINEVLTGILHEQAERLARSERIHHAFLKLVLQGQGLDAIARDLAALIGAPAIIRGVDGALLAAAGLDDLADVEVDRLLEDHAASTVRLDGRQRTVHTVPITSGVRDHGHVIVLASATTTGDEQLALENAATVAALAMTKELELRAIEDKYRADLVHELLGGIGDPHEAVHRARGFGWDLDRALVAIVLRADDPPASTPADLSRPSLVTTIEPLLATFDTAAAVAAFGNEAVVLSGVEAADRAHAGGSRFLRRLAAGARTALGGTVSLGVSRPVPDASAIGQAYAQAVRALVIGRQVKGAGGIVRFDDLGAYRILALVDDTQDLEVFADEILGELREPTRNAAQLRTTLQTLIDTSGNVAEAARRLHFHYNTLRYRIDKLTTMVGPFMTDARVRTDVQLALMIHRMADVRDR